MSETRKYGEPPFTAAVLHGGPGAAGEMAPVARALAGTAGVLEPLQAASSLEGQVEELRETLEAEAELPVVLIGWSWGAWLAYIFAARYPEMVRKLVLVSAGPFTTEHADKILETRMGRLGMADRGEVEGLMKLLDDPGAEGKDGALKRLGELLEAADAFSPRPLENQEETQVTCSYEIYSGVWRDAARLRASGRLLELGRSIRCPVTAIHGYEDPHPVTGVLGTLSLVIEEFRCVLLEDCGHRPWAERNAGELFIALLKEELED